MVQLIIVSKKMGSPYFCASHHGGGGTAASARHEVADAVDAFNKMQPGEFPLFQDGKRGANKPCFGGAYSCDAAFMKAKVFGA